MKVKNFQEELFSIFRTHWIGKSVFSTVNCLKSQYRSGISDEDLASQLRCVISVNYTLKYEKIQNTSLIIFLY